MSQYIEREEESGTLDTSSIVSSEVTDAEYNAKRWAWLINGWANMSWLEKYALFQPTVKHIYAKTEVSYENISAYFNSLINDAATSCRLISSIKFNQDKTPAILVVLAPIDVRCIPDETLRTNMKNWFNANIMPGITSGEVDAELLKLAERKY